MASTDTYAPVPKELPNDEPDDVLFSSLYGVRTVELNRPKKLNSLNASMCRKILPRLKEWEKSQMANIIIMSGAGEKALCAGGDVAELAKQNSTPEGQKKSSDYFALEYQLDQVIATYSKPYIAIMDGITMGGGVGLSVHAPFRIATERTVFAMPETTIGFFPDVGGSFFLPRLDGEIGTYLALTSERLMGVQAFYAGIATHYLDSSILGSLTSRLSELVFKDYSPLPDRLRLINSTINEFSSSLPSPASYPKSPNGNLTGPLRAAIDRCFAHDDMESILSALKQEADKNSDPKLKDWATATHKTILSRSPTSCKVTLRQLRVGRDWNISQSFVREHGIAAKFMAHQDFVEGVSSRLIAKPPKTPQWHPASLEEVKNSEVLRFFQMPPSEGTATASDGDAAATVERLQLIEPAPAALQQNYREYPHGNLALPREVDIENVVRDMGQNGAKAVVSEVVRRWNEKEGVREKVEDVLARRTSRTGDGVAWKSRDRL